MPGDRKTWIAICFSGALVLGCSGGEDDRGTPAATLASTSTSTTTTDPDTEGPKEVDQVIEDIAEGFDRFRTNSDDLETKLFGWAFASGTYERVAEGLRLRSPGDVPERVADDVADALSDAAAALMAAAECGAEALETAAGPAACDDAFDDATEAHRMVAVRLEPLIEYGSRPFPEVLALFS